MHFLSQSIRRWQLAAVTVVRRKAPGLEGLLITLCLIFSTRREIKRVWRYCIFTRGRQSSTGVLWPTHWNAGLFSCFATVLWSLADLARAGQLAFSIDNSLGMHNFKNHPEDSTWHEMFSQADPNKVKSLVDLTKMAPRQIDAHGDYVAMMTDKTFKTWLEACMDIYMRPSERVRDMAMGFAFDYKISSIPTMAVYIRGTDKWTEVTPTPLQIYFSHVDAWLESTPGSQVLIQTDQAQIRESFVERYGLRCRFIREIPVTTGAIVMHNSEELQMKRSEFAVLLCAMWESLSEARALLTCTSNVSFFLAMKMLIAGKQVIQLQ